MNCCFSFADQRSNDTSSIETNDNEEGEKGKNQSVHFLFALSTSSTSSIKTFKLAYYSTYEELGPAASTASTTYQNNSMYTPATTATTTNSTNWFDGMMENDHSSTNYHLNPTDLVSTPSLDIYRLPHETNNATSFYVPYQTTVIDSEHDENDLDEDSDDDDDDDESDSTYHLPKRTGNPSNNNSTGSNKGTGARRATRPNGSKRKRKRVLNGVQRAEATQREKRRMLKLNRAFEELRKVLPVTEFARNKLSRSETLKSAIDYINLMFDMLDAAKGHHSHHHHHQQQYHQSSFL